MDSLWRLGAEFRPGQSNVSEDHQWSLITSKLAEMARSKAERRINNFDYPRNTVETKPWDDGNFENLNLGIMKMDLMMNEAAATKSSFRNTSTVYNLNSIHQKSNNSINGGNINNNNSVVDKRFKTLPSTEMLPRNEILGGYIFICNNDTMKEDLKSRLFCLPPRFRDSVRAITPGLPIFMFNYTTRRLNGIFEAASFGGSNIDPTAWEDVKCKGESMFPAQVRIRVRKICKPLEEDAFRPLLYHYYGHRFRLQLSIAETLALLDLFEKGGTFREMSRTKNLTIPYT